MQPSELPLAAAWLGADGEPVAALRRCGDDRVGPLSLRDLSGTAGWRTSEDHESGSTTFPLPSPPRAWRAGTRGPQCFRPDRSYLLKAYGGQDGLSSYTIVLTLTSADLTALRPGQVWAGGRAMSLGEFEELAEDSC
ncbi:hypothetical protein [Streptomyces sp. P17]|uniref:hypothetical protein n=1 Tax=Streptomyces sp. P17 TaxID=3074716 RepID=UPI0028F456F9|nr:hypothetical protein [Streptomyces sp. P17]MDT9697401.1 hypothetical protein [Streptomyces sp. P17]